VPDVIYAIEIWLLTSVLVGWFLSRAAQTLCEPQVLFPADAEAAQSPLQASRASCDGSDWSIADAVRVFDEECARTTAPRTAPAQQAQ
jgi:hypothetical protein